MANKNKNKKGFAKLKGWQKAGIIVGGIIVIAAAGLGIYNLLTPEETPITAEYLLSGNLARDTFGSEAVLTGYMENTKGKYNFEITDSFDVDTDYAVTKISTPDNNLNFENYIEKIDKKLGIYYKEEKNWNLVLKPIISSVDNPLTDFIEINASTVDEAIMNSLSELSLEETDEEYIVKGKMSFTGLLAMLGNVTQSLYVYDTASPFAYLTKYGDYIFVNVKFTFDKTDFLLKDITANEDAASIEAVAKGMLQNQDNIVKKLSFAYKVINIEEKNIFVPTDVTNHVKKTTEIKSLYTE